MRFVTLNLDRSDAATLRNAVEVALTMCSCHAGACLRCDGLDAIYGDLNRLLGRRDQGAADDGRIGVPADADDLLRATRPGPEPQPASGAAGRLSLVPTATPTPDL